MKFFLLAFSVLFADVSFAFAQATASVEGVVRDTQGEPLLGATVVLQNIETGIVRGTRTNERGVYRFPSVSTAGTCTIHADYSGLKSTTINALVLRSGETRVIDIVLRTTEVEVAEVEVAANRASQLNRSNGEVSAFVTEQQIQTIPTDSRKITNQLYFLPGVSPATGYFPEAPNVSINGQNSLYTNYLIDGFDNNEQFLGGQKFDTPIGIAQNVAVLTNTYSAEFGRTANGIINITTKSGTNDWRGEAFYYGRPGNITDAANVFTPRDANGNFLDNGFRRDQAGFNTGGALRRDKTFLFLGGEYTQDFTDRILNTPVVRDQVRNRSTSSLFTAKLDHYWSPTQITSLRANVGVVKLDNNGGGAVMPSAGSFQDRNAYLVALKHNALLSSNFFSETRAQLSGFNWNYGRPKNGASPQVSLLDTTGTLLAVVGHPGFSFLSKQTTLQLANTFTRSLKQHTIKFGVDVLSTDHQLTGGGNPSGNYTVTLADPALLNNNGSAITLQTIPQSVTVNSYSVEVFPRSFGVRQTLITGFLEDSYKWTNRLTLNLGLRYDFDNLSKAGRASSDLNNIAPRTSFNYLLSENGLHVLRGGYGIFYEKILYAVQSDALQSSSRNPAFLNQLQTLINKGILPANTDLRRITFDGNVSATFQGASAPTYLQGKSAVELQNQLNTLPARELRIQNPNGLANPYSHQLSLGYQLQVTPDMLFSVDGVLLFGQNLVRLRDVNAPTPYSTTPFAQTGAPRPFADADSSRPAALALGGARQITMSETSGESRYQALILNLKKAFTNNYAFNIAYTLSWNRNNTDDINFRAMDANEFQNEWGFAVNDRRHVLSFIGSYRFDFGTTVSLTGLIQSGQPINRTVALSNAGAPPGVANAALYQGFYGHGVQSGDGFAGNLDRFPNVPRNGERLPGYTQFDVSVMHLLKIGGLGVEVRGDVFNIFNAINYSGYFANASETNRAQTGRPGSPIQFRSAGAPTQVQFSTRIVF
jgi:outer membrane receptor for ferrienterochelin and colicin